MNVYAWFLAGFCLARLRFCVALLVSLLLHPLPPTWFYLHYIYFPMLLPVCYLTGVQQGSFGVHKYQIIGVSPLLKAFTTPDGRNYGCSIFVLYIFRVKIL